MTVSEEEIVAAMRLVVAVASYSDCQWGGDSGSHETGGCGS